MHHDSGPEVGRARPATLLVYLNDGENGGEIIFPLTREMLFCSVDPSTFFFISDPFFLIPERLFLIPNFSYILRTIYINNIYLVRCSNPFTIMTWGCYVVV